MAKRATGDANGHPAETAQTEPLPVYGETARTAIDSDLTTKVATVGLIGLGVALIEASLIPGMIIGVAAALAPKYAPKVTENLRPLVKSVAPRADHGSPQLVQPRPGCLKASQSQHSLQTQGAGSVLLARHPPHGPEPHHQRLTRVLEDRPGGHGRLMPAIAALQTHRSKRPRLATPATRRRNPSGQSSRE